MDDSFDAIFSQHNPRTEVIQDEEVNTDTNDTVATVEEVVADDTADVVEDVPVVIEDAPVETPKVEAVVAPKEDRKNWVPVDALLEERTKRQEAEKARADFELKFRELETQKKQQNIPDFFENPDEFHAYLKDQQQQAIKAAIAEDRLSRQQEELAKIFGASHQKAVQSHGADTVQAALDWATERAKADEAWGHNSLSQPDPVAWILEQQTRHALIDEISSAESMEDFIARKAAEMGIAATTPVVAAQTTPMAAKVAAPRSLASASSNGRNTGNGKTGDDAFNAIFKK